MGAHGSESGESSHSRDGRAKVGQVGSFGSFGPCSSEFGRVWPNLDQHRPKLEEHRPTSAQVWQQSATLGRFGPNRSTLKFLETDRGENIEKCWTACARGRGSGNFREFRPSSRSNKVQTCRSSPASGQLPDAHHSFASKQAIQTRIQVVIPAIGSKCGQETERGRPKPIWPSLTRRSRQQELSPESSV